MDEFESLFGIPRVSVKKVCILLPFLSKGILKKFNLKNLHKGTLFSCGHSRHFTLIHTGIGPCFSGDAVLHLKDTPCRDIIFFGSCGLTHASDGLDIGSLVIPSPVYAFESFSDILLENTANPPVGHAHKDLLEGFLNHPCAKDFRKVVGATFGSLKLEPEHLETFSQKQIDVLDMECSAVYQAAKHVEKRAVALLYATDIVAEKPYYSQLSPEHETTLKQTVNHAVQSILQFSKFLYSL